MSVRLYSNVIVVRYVDVPGAPSSSGSEGDLALDSDYAYFCIADDTWKRVALSTWTPATPGSGEPMGLLLALTYS